MNAVTGLPPAFSDLEDLLKTWANPDMASRNRVRREVGMAAVDAFYGRMVGRMDAIMQRLSECAYSDALPADEQNLYYLACAFMEVSPAAEKFRTVEVPDGFPVERLEFLE